MPIACDLAKVVILWHSGCSDDQPLTLGFRAVLQQRVEQLPDCRKGRNTQYHMPNAALGAFGIFFTQSPLFLSTNVGSKHTMAAITPTRCFGHESSCDNHIRTLLDPIAPSHFDPVFVLQFDQFTRLCVAASPLYRPCWDFFGGFSVRRLGAQVPKNARHGGPDSSPTGPQIGRVCDPTARWPAVGKPPQSPLTGSPRAAPN